MKVLVIGPGFDIHATVRTAREFGGVILFDGVLPKDFIDINIVNADNAMSFKFTIDPVIRITPAIIPVIADPKPWTKHAKHKRKF